MLKFAQLSVNDIHLQTDVNYSHSLRKRLHSQHPHIQSPPCLDVHLLKHCLVEKADVIHKIKPKELIGFMYDSIATVGEIRVYWRADFQSGSRVLKKVF